jgi:hypothetical protein
VTVPLTVRQPYLSEVAPLVQCYADHLVWTKERGEACDGPFIPTDKPFWDAERRELSFQGKVVRKIRRYPRSPLDKVLETFAEEGWPPHIDDPVSWPEGCLPMRKRYEVVQSLNEGLTAIKFFTDGEGYGWRVQPSA